MFVLCSCCIYHVPMHWIRVVSVVTNINVGEMHVTCRTRTCTCMWHACVLDGWIVWCLQVACAQEGLDRMVHTSGRCIGKIAVPYGSRIDAQTQLLACACIHRGGMYATIYKQSVCNLQKQSAYISRTYCTLLFALILYLFRACGQISRCGIHA